VKARRSPTHGDVGYSFDFVFNERCYTPPELPIYQNDVVVDVGAHIGRFTILAAKRARTGLLCAYQPMPKNFNLRKQNIRLNSPSDAIAFKLRIVGSARKRELFLTRDS
jgi:hypothetical protein